MHIDWSNLEKLHQYSLPCLLFQSVADVMSCCKSSTQSPDSRVNSVGVSENPQFPLVQALPWLWKLHCQPSVSKPLPSISDSSPRGTGASATVHRALDHPSVSQRRLVSLDSHCSSQSPRLLRPCTLKESPALHQLQCVI